MGKNPLFGLREEEEVAYRKIREAAIKEGLDKEVAELDSLYGTIKAGADYIQERATPYFAAKVRFYKLMEELVDKKAR